MHLRSKLLSRWSSAAASAHAAGRARRFALCCALAYAVLALLWVLLSAEFADLITQDRSLLLRLYQAKGLMLVAMTTLLVYAAALAVARRSGDHEQALRRREQQLGGIVDTAMDAIITVDEAQRIVVFNRAAGEVFRLPAEQALGQSLDRFLPARLQAAHREHVQRFSDDGKTSRRMGRLHALVGLRADGEEFPMEASVSRLVDGERVLMTVVLRDASEQRAAEQAREAQRAAEAASTAKTQFLAGMSHELRTPLNAILGFSQLLLSEPAKSLDPAQSHQVEHIRQAGWHLLALVNDVLDVSRIESGALLLDCRSVDLHTLLDEAWLLTHKLAQRHAVAMEAAYREAPAASAWCDPLRLRQVLVNLLSNAVKYNRPGGQVRVELALDGPNVCLQFIDSGLGMTQDQLAHLYEPFNRLGRERGGVEGTGIGLALSRKLVLMMDGALEIDSVPGEGTRVRLVLPWSAPAPRVPAAPAPASAISLPVGQPLPTVLYIEDNPVNMLVVEQLLARWPIARLAQAEDGATGLALARRLQPELILLDMRLPDMSGLEVLQALRTDPATASLRAVAVSASAMADDMAQARQGGAIDYWTKPLQFEQFLQDVQRLLARRGEPA